MITALILASAMFAHTSTVADRQFVNLTVYNGGVALVHDRRRVRLNAGVNRLGWRDVSATMDATSALLESLTSDKVDVLEQNFNFDVLNPQALLQKSVGREVIVVHPAAIAGGRETREPARILSINDGIILQYRDRIETDLRGGYIVYPYSPGSFRDRPTLDLDLDVPDSGLHTLDLSYISEGLSWYTDYVGQLTPDETHLSLTGFVTLSNTSGTSFSNAHLQLVAGNVNVTRPALGHALKTIASVRSATSDIYNVSEQNYFEYHIYTMHRPTTLADKQTKQLTLLTAHDVPVQKTLELRGLSNYYEMADADLGNRLPVSVYVSFENRGGELGIPLPAGNFRVYEKDSHNVSQFLGSDTIAHTPKNQTVRLRLGESFDVTARKRQTGYHIVSNCSSESAYEIRLDNAKDIPQTVRVIEPIPGDWQMLFESAPHTKSSFATATWDVSVPANGTSTLTYRTQVTWCRSHERAP